MAERVNRNGGVIEAGRGHGREMPEPSANRPDPRTGPRHDSRHATDVRRRKGIWTAACHCGWTSEAMSAFTAWSATRRHLTDTGTIAIRPPAPKHPNVRLLDEPSQPPAH